ncbi:MAG TPA: hypothetical protein QF555_04605 [Candidatus Thalassarchaeaceae archaeon]|nr:hypothetical protein [Candidatus Thalassarchaeaceae archaeon]
MEGGFRGLIGILPFVLLIGMIPLAEGELATNQTLLNATCIDDSTCQLTNSITGIDQLTGNENGASPLSPEVIRIEFKMSPPQSSHALIPITMDELVVDLTIEEDPGEFLRPDLNIILAIGPSSNEWTIEGQPGTPLTTATEYRLEDEQIDLTSGRILAPNDVIQLTLSFEIDRPVTWNLGLRGSTYVDIPIQWSLDQDAVDVDEPSSSTEPKSIEMGDFVNGALIEEDIDCFTFSVGERASELRVDIIWSPMPSEIAITGVTPILDTLDGRKQPSPSIRTTQEGDSIESILVWNLKDHAELRLCLFGEDARFGVYRWAAQEILPGTGAMEVSDFELDARWPTGTGWIGETSQSQQTEGIGGTGTIISICIGGIIVAWILKMPIINPLNRKWGIPTSMILIVIGSSAGPLAATISSLPDESENNLDYWIESRLDLVAESIIKNEPDLATGFFGTKSGDQFGIRLHIEAIHPTGDGRWQIQTEDLKDVDLDRLIFDAMRRHSLDSDQEIMYILRAGRLLSLDLLLLEATLISDSIPIGSILHLNWKMTASVGEGSISERVWTTRPNSIDLNEWDYFTTRLLPELITVSYCDCGLDAIDLSIRTSVAHTPSITPSLRGVSGAPSFPLFSGAIMGLGFGTLMLIGLITKNQQRKAQKIVLQMSKK